MSKHGFDVIVVGGGSAGCILAARLSEEPDRTVLLVEAGSDVPDADSLPPALQVRPATAVFESDFMWTYPDTGLNPAVRGRILGGSGGVNGAVFVRGIPEDYNSWPLDQWRFAEVLPAFRRVEADLDFADRWHGSDGPIPIRRFRRPEWHPLQTALFDAARECGFPEKPDLNAPEGSGVGPLPRNDPDGLRMSAALGYLSPIRSRRPNLVVWAETVATRVLLERSRAIGVEVIRDGNRQTVLGGEVILSAGTIASPLLLMQSGIGAQATLKELDIDVGHDLPGVGENLRDHPVIWVAARCDDPARRPQRGEPMQVGLTCTAPGSASRCDIQVLAGPEWNDNARAGAPAGDLVLITSLEHPLSQGRIVPRRANGELLPRLDFGFLQHPEDRDRLRYGVQLMIELLESPAFGQLAGVRVSPSDEDRRSDTTLDRWVAATVRAGQHACGTCRMGMSDDPRAVVGATGSVHGLEGLRVADLSIVPDNVRANTNATAMMVGERIAELIQEEANA